MSYKMDTLQSSSEDSYLIIQLWMKQIGWTNYGKRLARVLREEFPEEMMTKLNSYAKSKEQKCPRQREKYMQWLLDTNCIKNTLKRPVLLEYTEQQKEMGLEKLGKLLKEFNKD